VDSAVFDAAAFDDFCRGAGFDDVPIFLFSLEPGTDNGTVYSRMFAPNAGVPEDPATGSACGPLGCYLVRNKVVTPEEAGAMLNVQGVKMGRPSYIHIAIGVDGGRASSVRVGGRSVFVGEGTLYL
jgi:trans-2,3-dihydro-3-hydroxyanthranilate isomerase